MHDLGAIPGNGFCQRAFTELIAQAVFQELIQSLIGDKHITAYVGIKLLCIIDAPFDIGINRQVFLFRGQKPLRIGIQSLQTAIEFLDGIHQRHFEMQAGLVV